MVSRISFILIVFSFSFAFPQVNEKEKLLNQSFQQAFTSPDDAIKTAEFLSETVADLHLKAKVNLLLAEAHYAKGNYELSLEHAFKAKKMSENEGYVNAESTVFICESLNFLQLKNEAAEIAGKAMGNKEMKIYREYLRAQNLSYGNSARRMRSLISKTGETRLSKIIQMLILNKLSEECTKIRLPDSAIYFAGEAVRFSEDQNLGNFWQSQSLLTLGKKYFLQQKNASALETFRKALLKAESLGNPFLEMEIHQELSTSYLAFKDNDNFYFHNQQALQLDNTVDQKENKAANTAHQLLSSEEDTRFQASEKNYRAWIYGLAGVFLVLLILKLVLFFRNRAKLKTYNMLLDYLHKQEDMRETEEKPVHAAENRTLVILKENEENILKGLNKFENTKKFTSKDMSLSVLAGQLNTNTKYLSEIINHHKQKNFNSYINELRINYITEKLKSEPNYLNYKVSYLAEEAGFSSHSTFTTVFKSIVGVSPIAFVEFLKKQKTVVE